MTSGSTKKPLSPSERDAQIEELKNKIKELEGANKEPRKDSKPHDDGEKDIRLDAYISVMSLLPYTLNLSTAGMGQGSVKKFTRFGEVKRILYKDLVDIVEAHRNFVEAGFFYIMSDPVIRQLGLDDVYSKILTKEKIEEILDTANQDECIELYNSANEKQQNVIVYLLINKMRNDPTSVNLNVIDKISKLAKIDIAQKAEEANEMQKELESQADKK